jgi:hypothetical protein
MLDGARETDGLFYHPAEVGPNDVWKGKTWQDMPGGGGKSEFMRRATFSLFRRGLHSGECDDEGYRRTALMRLKKKLKNQSIADS